MWGFTENSLCLIASQYFHYIAKKATSFIRFTVLKIKKDIKWCTEMLCQYFVIMFQLPMCPRIHWIALWEQHRRLFDSQMWEQCHLRWLGAGLWMQMFARLHGWVSFLEKLLFNSSKTKSSFCKWIKLINYYLGWMKKIFIYVFFCFVVGVLHCLLFISFFWTIIE